MSIKLKHKVYNDYLWAEFSGTRTAGKEIEEGINTWKQVAIIAKKENHTKILVVSKVRGRIPVTSIFKITEALDHIGWQIDFKIAQAAKDKVVFTNLSIFETIMKNLGYEAKMFENEHHAKKWLL